METEVKFRDLTCPYCSKTVSFPEDTQLKVQECPECLESIILPEEPSEVAEKVPLPIATPRMILRRFERQDCNDVCELLGDERLYQYMPGGPMSPEQVPGWLEKDFYKKLTSPNTEFCLAMQNRQSEKVIGEVQWRLFGDDCAYLDLYVHRNAQRVGFGTEALQAILGFCFNVLGVRRMVLLCDTRNTAAWRMVEKVHMRREGEFVKDRFLNGEWANTFQYAILAEEFVDTAPV